MNIDADTLARWHQRLEDASGCIGTAANEAENNGAPRRAEYLREIVQPEVEAVLKEIWNAFRDAVSAEARAA
jgi:hypothetical protein